MMPLDRFGQEVGDPVEGWSARRRPEPRLLNGRWCRLEPLSVDRHAAALAASFAAAPDGRDWAYLPDERPDDEAAFAALLGPRASSADPLFFAVAPTLAHEADAAAGTIALMRIDPPNGVIEIGHVNYAPRLQRSAAATEAVFLLLAYAFDDLGYRRVEWKCDALNGRSRRAAKRFGFTYEGTFRQAVVTKGRNRDTAWFAMIDREWPAARERLVHWLRPANFDAAGVQIERLGPPPTTGG